MSSIVTFLHDAGQLDFTCLGPATLSRHVERRMHAWSVESLSEYVGILERDDEERRALQARLLSNGKTFFEEPKVWDFIGEHVIPAIVRRPDPLRPLRAWVPLCGSGAEAYSLAMLLLEATRASGIAPAIQVFASDVDQSALDGARAGMYPQVATRVVEARFGRYLAEEQWGCRVTPELRRSVIFARHDLFSDPPFSHLDIVCCRNVLQYLRYGTRIRVVNLLRGALRADGYLAVGRNDDVRRLAEGLEPVSRHYAIYRRIDGRPAVPCTPTPGETALKLRTARVAADPDHVDDGSNAKGQLARVLRLVEMGKLAAGLAHEVGQPLTAVTNLLEALAVGLRRETLERRGQLDLVEQAIAQSDRAGRIIVHIARLLRNGERLTEQCDVRHIVARATDLVGPGIRQHGIMLRLLNSDVPCRGWVCPVEIEQVVVNLLQNAIDAVLIDGSQQRQITVATTLVAPEHVKLRITDSGPGIPSQVAERMFEPFFTTKPDGLGMGLAISRSIIDEHGGCIWVEDPGEPGAGIRFVLPLRRPEPRSSTENDS